MPRALFAIAQHVLLPLLLALSCASGLANPLDLTGSQQVLLWGGTGAPDTAGRFLQERVINTSAHPDFPERDIRGITAPSMYMFAPATPNGAAVIVLPGGGYGKIVFDKEGVEIARWLNAAGFTAFVLKYRLPGEWQEIGLRMARQDAQRAVRLVRGRATEWHINPRRIAMMGFSAGGHLAVMSGTQWNDRLYEPRDEYDMLNARPDSLAIVYGMLDEHTVPPDTPPTFIVAADDDRTVDPVLSTQLYLALHRARVPVEMHIYGDGGHGFALRRSGLPVAEWQLRWLEWLRTTAFLPR